MAINFPNSPTQGDIYTNNNVTWQYDGTAWNIIPSSGQINPNTFASISQLGGGSISAKNASDTLNVVSGENILLKLDNTTNTLTISAPVDEQYSFNIAADDSTLIKVSNDESIQFIGGTGITTQSDAEGNITITNTSAFSTFNSLQDVSGAGLKVDRVYEPAMTMFRLDNVGTTAYTFEPQYSGQDPNLYVLAGTTVAFNLDGIPNLPFEIQNSAGDPYNTGLVHIDNDGTVTVGADAQGKDSGTLYWRIPESISGTYRYECQLYPAMFGQIIVKRLSVI